MRWPWSKPSIDPPASLIERVEQLEDDYRRLERRFVRLQGEFDRVNRVQVEEADEEQEEFLDMVEERKHRAS